MLDASKTSADLVREYALDHYIHYGFLPSDVEVDGHVFDYETYNYMIDLFFPEFHKEALKGRMKRLREGFEKCQLRLCHFYYCPLLQPFRYFPMV